MLWRYYKSKTRECNSSSSSNTMLSRYYGECGLSLSNTILSRYYGSKTGECGLSSSAFMLSKYNENKTREYDSLSAYNTVLSRFYKNKTKESAPSMLSGCYENKMLECHVLFFIQSFAILIWE